MRVLATIVLGKDENGKSIFGIDEKQSRISTKISNEVFKRYKDCKRGEKHKSPNSKTQRCDHCNYRLKYSHEPYTKNPFLKNHNFAYDYEYSFEKIKQEFQEKKNSKSIWNFLKI